MTFGSFVDQACSYWTQKECSSRNYCSIYDLSVFRNNFFTLLIMSVCCALALSLLVECVGKERMRKEEEDSAQYEAADGQERKMLAQADDGEENQMEVNKKPKTKTIRV